ncbi:putative beta-glucosidase [Helianthus annuus]|nr:putative beta-glucosidase [Helianthus annuus]KAJ0589401.1 putative beta-glucosidase [Helianthus annuus]KAJ0633856.1 putative beta-glucosidase [Helianthus annuus]KAJ0637650.1 putative beta-glucosidase [Helianthus annuus]KAJ0828059.1 putative beta-glucosidase [Helianthus annuus]
MGYIVTSRNYDGHIGNLELLMCELCRLQDWIYVYPKGMEMMVTYLMNRYSNTPMFITKNGKI